MERRRVQLRSGRWWRPPKPRPKSPGASPRVVAALLAAFQGGERGKAKQADSKVSFVTAAGQLCRKDEAIKGKAQAEPLLCLADFAVGSAEGKPSDFEKASKEKSLELRELKSSMLQLRVDFASSQAKRQQAQDKWQRAQRQLQAKHWQAQQMQSGTASEAAPELAPTLEAWAVTALHSLKAIIARQAQSESQNAERVTTLNMAWATAKTEQAELRRKLKRLTAKLTSTEQDLASATATAQMQATLRPLTAQLNAAKKRVENGRGAAAVHEMAVLEADYDGLVSDYEVLADRFNALIAVQNPIRIVQKRIAEIQGLKDSQNTAALHDAIDQLCLYVTNKFDPILAEVAG